MAVANSETKGDRLECSSSSDAVFDAIKRKLSKVQANIESNYESVVQRILPGRRKSGPYSRPNSLYDIDSEGEWLPYLENIEMASMKQRGTGRGHQFVDCQLTNPTWCDKCGDFIWGLYKQCQKCKNCQYTCHYNCVPSVTLDCMTVSPGTTGGPVATPSDLSSPCNSEETCLTEHQPLVGLTAQQEPQFPFTTAKSELPLPTTSHLSPPGAARRVPNPPENVSSVSSPLEKDPLEARVSQNTLTSSVSWSTASQATVHVDRDLNQNAKNNEGRSADHVCEIPSEKDETDSGYRSGTIPDEKLPKAPSQTTLDRRELQHKFERFNHFVPKAALELVEGGKTFQGFLRVTLNLVRPITMELGARPPSIYEMLTREHIVEQSTQHIAFYMPRDTVKSIHISSTTTTREVITNLLKKFHIVDNPRKFAMYEQVFNDKNKLVKLRRLADRDFPLTALLSWEPELIKYYRLVLQENETGEIVWDAFSSPELNNFMVVLDREEREAIAQLQYKYRVMKRIIIQRMKELRKNRSSPTESTA